jgi:hypothetical protein
VRLDEDADLLPRLAADAAEAAEADEAGMAAEAAEADEAGDPIEDAERRFLVVTGRTGPGPARTPRSTAPTGVQTEHEKRTRKSVRKSGSRSRSSPSESEEITTRKSSVAIRVNPQKKAKSEPPVVGAAFYPRRSRFREEKSVLFFSIFQKNVFFRLFCFCVFVFLCLCLCLCFCVCVCVCVFVFLLFVVLVTPPPKKAAPCSITDPGAARNKRFSVSWGSPRWWLDAPLVGKKSRYLNEKTTPKKGPSDGKKGLTSALCARKGARPYGCG